MTTPQQLLARCKALAGSYTRSHHDTRACSHCGLPLTDPASWERGVGPICARNSTTLFAREMKFQGSYALAHLFAIKADAIPEQIRGFWQSEFVPVALDILKHSCASTSALETHGVDLRDLARVVAWILSHKIERKTKVTLVNFVKYLGYVGYAAVLAGDASTGPATLKFNEDTGVVELVGSRCKAGMRELRLNVPSVLFPNYLSKAFTAAAADAGRFCELAIEYWPMVSGDTKEIQEKAAKWLETHPVIEKLTSTPVRGVAVPAVVHATPKATLRKEKYTFFVHFDWTNEVYGVVGKIKNLVPPKERAYHSSPSEWEINNMYFDQVVAIVKESAPNHSLVGV